MATKLTDEASIDQIISEMSVHEKVACVTGGSSFYSRKMEKYGIPETLWLDGGTGVNTNQYFLDYTYRQWAKKREEEGNPVDDEEFTGRMGGLDVVLNDSELWKLRHQYARENLGNDKNYGCYPSGMFFGATWNPEVIEACGRTLGEEASVRKVDVLLGTPNVNIHRDPRNGRLFEGYSEDPCLTAKLAPSFVKGVQSEGVIADVKHFAANNQETDRMGVNEHISERALREIYLPGFEACIKAGCKTIMTAYNKINGVPCAQNPWLLQEVLRKEWGFQGCVVTDWSAAYDQAEAYGAGNDLIMPGPRQLKCVEEAVETEKLSMEALDECVRNFLKLILESPAMKGRKESFDMNKGIQAAYDAAREGITLLKNNGILPLDSSAKLAFYGEASLKTMDCGAGSAAVNTNLTTNVYDCMAGLIGKDRVLFGKTDEETTAVIVTVRACGQEGADRPDMLMEAEDRKVLDEAIKEAKIKKLPVIVILNVAAPVQLIDWIDDVDAVLCMYLPGMQGGQAMAEILLGKINPSGKLPITFPKYYRDTPSYGNFPGYDSDVWYGEGIYVGYRYYEKKKVPVMYPFGYGLSYTTFKISNLQIPEQIDLDREEMHVHVSVENTGKVAGAEVVQLYIHDESATLDKPYKELKAFKKVYLEPGCKEEIELTLTKKDFASYDTRLGAWATEPGKFVIMIGNSSVDIAVEQIAEVLCDNPYAIGPKSDIVDIVSNQRAMNIVEEITGIVLKETVGSYIVFQPHTPFDQIWEDVIKDKLNISNEEAELKLQQIYKKWERI